VRWPDRYSFDVEAELQVRNRQRQQCLNSWRAAHNLPPVPVPQLKPVSVELSVKNSQQLAKIVASSPELSRADRL
jgi:hypothetical protein